MTSTVVATLVATGLRLVASHAYAEGAPAGFSGGFKEASCHACHFHAEPNSPPGRVTIDGMPQQFTGGERYTLTITLTRPDMKRAGFQLTTRFKDTGGQAGTLVSGDAGRAGVQTDGGIQYAGQTKGGSTVSEPGVSRWTVVWTAPASGGPVVVNVAANAADGNESADGDYVYTASVEMGSPREDIRED